MRTKMSENYGPDIIESKNVDKPYLQSEAEKMRIGSATSARADLGNEQSVMKWGGLAGMMGAILFILTAILLLGFSSGANDTEALLVGFPQERSVIAVGEIIYFAAIILWAILFLGLYRALRGTSAAPALFGTGLGIMGLIALAVGALPYIAFSAISDLYHAPGATAEEQSQLVQMWSATQGIFNETDTVGFTLMALGFIVLGVAMLRSPAFGKCIGRAGVVLGAVVAAGMLVIGVDSILSFPFVLLAFVLLPVMFGRKLYGLSKTG